MQMNWDSLARWGETCHATAARGYGSRLSPGRRGWVGAASSPRHALHVRGRRRVGGFQGVELGRPHVAQYLHMGNEVGAADEAEVQRVAIALHGDVERQSMRAHRHP